MFTLTNPDGTTRRAVGAGQKSGEFWMLDAATGLLTDRHVVSVRQRRSVSIDV
ncbi:hypothetical protein [Dactylosporangium sp. CA-233914]|uniref:hypothetical protein n=1 Tax=Dactylosporangium sp. CA-233914 TaxID=3239934 RepID=UPI003D8F627E